MKEVSSFIAEQEMMLDYLCGKLADCAILSITWTKAELTAALAHPGNAIILPVIGPHPGAVITDEDEPMCVYGPDGEIDQRATDALKWRYAARAHALRAMRGAE